MCGFVIGMSAYSDYDFMHEIVAFTTHIVGRALNPNKGSFLVNFGSAVMSDAERAAMAWCKKHSKKPLFPADGVVTPGWYNDGLGGFYQEGSAPDVARYEAYIRKRIDEVSRDYSGSKREKQVKEFEDLLVRGPDKFPAFMGIAIWFDAEPPEDVQEVLKTRAKAFADTHPDKPKIMGFRLIPG